MPKESGPQTSDVAKALLDYLAERPGNADTQDGIARWWILRQHIETCRETVKAALDELVARGKVERIRITGQTLFRLNNSGDQDGDG